MIRLKNKVFILYLFITIAFFGMLIKLEYATDTYAVFNFDKEAVYMQYAMSGRFITGAVLKFFKIINTSEKLIYEVSYILAIFCTALSQFFLYKIIRKENVQVTKQPYESKGYNFVASEKDIKSKVLTIIIPTLIIINPFSIELFLFIEKGFMWLGILFCVLALMNLQKYFESNRISGISNSITNNATINQKDAIVNKDLKNKINERSFNNTILKYNKKYLLYGLILMFIANCLYQGVVGIFLSIALVYILKFSKNIKEFIANNFIAGFIYAIPALINFLFVKIKFKESRINGQIVILDSLEKIWQNTSNMFKTMYGILPKYTFILLILFTFAVFCSKIWKEEKKLLLILKFVYILVGITFIAIAPQILQPTNLIWFGPRSTYSFASMYGVLTLYLAMNYELEGISKYAIIIFSVILLTFQVQKFIKIEKDRYWLNKNDSSITMQVKEQIDEYEKQTGNVITDLSWYEDEKPQYTYKGIFVTSDMNVKSYSSDWSTVEILKYYLKREIKLVKKDENLEKEFKSKNWDEFDEKQIVFENNKLHLCNY